MENMRVYAEINLKNIKKNAQSVKKLTGKSVKLMAVIKADGYGHGAVECADTIKDIADAFAVATIEEALSLRNHGIKNEILVLGYVFPGRYSEAIENDISLTVFDYDSALEISETAEKIGKEAILHIAVDTGMGRVGFFPDEQGAETVLKISELPMLVIEGLFSHFATSDEKDKTYSKEQTEKFLEFYELLLQKGVKIPIRHINNSAGIMELPDSAFDMVRMGIVLYGLYPSENVDKEKLSLLPAMTLKSSVVYVKTVKKGTSVSYGRHFTASKDTRVATVSVGYADGYPRLLSGRGRVLINGKFASVIGNVCMDQMMVDITEIDDVKVGSEVVLMGESGENRITADEIADLAGTINYEIVCGITGRVPRIYNGN